MTTTASDILKEDIKNLKNGDFRPLTANETYGTGLKFVMIYTVSMTLLHLILLYITSFTGHYPLSIMAKQLPNYIISNFCAALVMTVFLSNYFLLYCYFKNIFKSRKIIRDLIIKAVVFYILALAMFDFYQINNTHTHSEFYIIIFFSFIPSFIFTMFFVGFEVNRLALGPAVELITEKIVYFKKNEAK